MPCASWPPTAATASPLPAATRRYRPDEFRRTGIARQWVEQILPRPGKYRSGLPTIIVGRWTGSMGEGLAIGLAALGAKVVGGPMAQLNDAIEPIDVEGTDFSVQLPTERLLTVDGLPREYWLPAVHGQPPAASARADPARRR